MNHDFTTSPGTVHDLVREGYARIARAAPEPPPPAARACCGPACCGGATAAPDRVAEANGYSAGELAAAPPGANMGLSCGNPTAIAALRAGEVVVDLGAGGGLDCFLAGAAVGPHGRVIGVDMTPEMVARARRHLEDYRHRTGLDNVEFRLGEIEHLPLRDASADVVISNCVLNLSPDKPQVWREVARVLRPGGRVAISDLALRRPLPEEVRRDVAALVGCIAGAVTIEATRRMAEAAGLVEISVRPREAVMDALADLQDPLYRRIAEKLPGGSQPGDYIASVEITARRPAPED